MHLRLEALEDRIVFDGAVAHDVAAPPTQSPAADAHSTDLATGITTPTQMHVLVVSKAVVEHAALEQAAKDAGTLVVAFDPNISLEALSAQINQALAGEKAVSIAFATDGAKGNFNLVNGVRVSDATMKASPENRDLINFWTNLATQLEPNGAVDILGCNVAAGAEGAQFLHDLGTLINTSGTDIALNASTNFTGSSSLGGDWVLESSTGTDIGIDAGSRYFVVGELAAWDHVLAPGINVTPISGLNTTGTGGTDSFSVVLNSAPTSNVVIGISSSNTGEGTVSTNLLTFTPLNWFTAQVVTVTGVNDGIAHAVGYTIITDPASSLDLTYNGINPSDVSVTNTSVEPSISITNSVVHNEGNAGTGTYTFNVTLDYKSSLPIDVSYTVANGTAIAGVDYFGAFGVLNFAPGETSHTIVVTVIGDNFFESNETFSVVLSAPTNATIAAGTGVGTIINDDATPAIIVTPTSGLTTTGTGGSSSFSVVLSSAPTDNTTIAISSSNLNEGTVSIPSLTFNSSNWNISQTVNVTGVNDGIAHSVAYSVITGAATSTDANFAGINPSNVSVTNTSVVPSLSINSVAHNEGNSGTTAYIFTVTMNYSSSLNVTVNYATANGSAVAGTDYNAASGTLTFLPGVLTQNITVFVNGDVTSESNETFIINLTTPTNATLNNSTGVGTITNDDFIPATVALPVTVRDFLMSSGVSGPPPVPGISTNPDFETTTSGFGPGLVSNILGVDGKPVYLGTGGGAASTHGSFYFNQWYNNVPNYNVSIPYALNLVYNPGTGLYDFNASNAQYFPIDGQGFGNQGKAHNFSFTTELHTSFTYTGGETFQLTGDDDLFVFINNRLVGDLGGLHLPQTINLNLGFSSNPSSLASQIGLVAGQIYRFDLFHAERHTTQSNLQFSTNLSFAGLSIGDVSYVEGNAGTTNAIFTVSLSTASLDTITVNYATVDNTALTSDNDYIATSGLLTFAPGQLTKTISVPIIGDTKFENNETFLINLSNAQNSLITDSQAIGTIQNDDALPTISVGDASIVEGNSGTSILTFTVTRNGMTDRDITFNYATANGTATTADFDYVAASGSRTITATGPGTTTIAVTIIGDLKLETNEIFSVNVTGATNTLNLNTSGTGTILNDDALPVLTISNVSILEGNSGTSIMTFTVTRTGFSDLPVNFNYATADGTATLANNDYQAVSASGTIAGGGVSASTTISVLIVGDLRYETNETLFINITGATNVANSSVTGTGTILNDDAVPTLNVNNVSIIEGNAGTSIMTFTVTRTGLSDLVVNFNYATADGTATLANNDYQSATGLGTIAAGGASATTTVAVTIVGDLRYETDETLALNVTGATNVANATASATGTILNDDAAPTLTVNNVSIIEGDAGTSILTFTVTRTGFSDLAVNFNYTTADGTATLANNDYQLSSGSGTIVAGGASGTTTIGVTIIGDLRYEADETFALNVSGATNTANSTASGTGTILNDDAVPTLSINDVSIVEGNVGTSTLTFTVTRTGLSDLDVNFNYATANGTATIANNDYLSATGTGTIAGGGASATTTIAVTIVGDFRYELDETFTVNVTGATNVTNPAVTGTGTILNDDAQPTLSINNVSQLEGDAGTSIMTFTVTRTGLSDLPVNFSYATADGTALLSDNDYLSSSGSGTIAAGGLTASTTITVTIVGDVTVETDETFTVNVTGATNVSNPNVTGTGTILNDDGAPILSIDNVSIVEGNSGTSILTFTVTRNGASALDVTFDYITADGTATLANNDYLSATGTGFIAGGGASGSTTISVTIIGDLVFETDETFTVDVTNATNVANSSVTGTGTILNDDTAPLLTVDNVSIIEGNSGTSTLVFTITRTGLSDLGVNFDYTTVNGTATTTDNDLIIQSGSGFIAAGGATGTTTVAVTIVGDFRYENDETFTLFVDNATNTLNSSASGTGTILNDDAAPTITVNSVSIAEGNAGTSILTFTVTRTGLTDLAVNFNYTTADGTATLADNDYLLATGSGSIAAGGITGTTTIAVTIVGDVKYETDETFGLNISGATDTLNATASGTGTINNDDAAPTITVNNVSITEGNAGTSIMTFTVTRTGLTALDVNFNYATADGTATLADNDYLAASGSGTILAGGASATTTVDVTIVGDVKYELDETFALNVSGATNAANETASGTGTILNDDLTPTLTISIDNVTFPEGNSGTTVRTFTVTRNGLSDVAVDFNYATADGTATLSNNDYISAVGTGTIAGGGASASTTVSVFVVGDLRYETDETFTLDVTSATNTFNSSASATATILNDDAPPTITVNEVSIVEGNFGTSLLIFTVTRNGPSDLDVNFNYSTSDGTATLANNDYSFATGSGLILGGGTSATTTVAVTIIGDLVYESNETFSLNVSGATNAASDTASGTGTILNDDAAPILSINNVAILEGNSGTSIMTFTVTRTGLSDLPVDFNYATTDDTATTLNNDYFAAFGTGTIAAGGAFATTTINVTIVGDIVLEGGDTFFMNITGATNVQNPSVTGVGTILNDDGTPILTINNVAILEGNTGDTPQLVFTVTRNGPSDLNTTFDFTTADGTATLANNDYIFATGSGIIFGGSTNTTTISVNIVGDLVYEANETFTLILSNATNTLNTGATGTGTILNDDAAPTLSINNVSIVEGNAGTSIMTFTVTRTGASDVDVNFNYNTLDGTATIADSDYVAGTGTGFIAGGGLSGTTTVDVTINGDTKYENDETFTLNITGATDTANATADGTGTILNDDGAPTISINNVSIIEGDVGITLLTFTVTRTGLSDVNVNFNYATLDGTATLANNDYLSATGSGTILGGGASATTTIAVTIVGDFVYENDETFTVNVTGATDSSNSTATGTGTILNDDAAPILSINNAVLIEGNSGTSTMIFTVTRTGLSDLPVDFNYSTADNTATTANNDYLAVSGTGQIASGGAFATTVINVTIIGDTTFEGNDTFFMNVTGATNVQNPSVTGIGTIINDDGTPLLSVNTVAIVEGNAGTSILTFTVTRTGASDLGVNFNYNTTDGTATIADSDYVAGSGTGFIAGGGLSGTTTIDVTINGDTKYEANETFTLNISGATNTFNANANSTGTILNDDAAPTLSIDNVLIVEGDVGASIMTFTVTRTGETAFTATFNYATANNTALSGSDYIATSGIGSIAAGGLTATTTINVFIINDTIVEPNKTFFVNLSNPINSTIAVPQGVGTINDNDTTAIYIADIDPIIGSHTSTTVGGDGTTAPLVFEVRLTNPSELTTTFSFATGDGTATTAHNDYVAASGVVTFNPGQTTAFITVIANGESNANKPAQNMQMLLSNPSNAVLAGTTYIGTIITDYTPPVDNTPFVTPPSLPASTPAPAPLATVNTHIITAYEITLPAPAFTTYEPIIEFRPDIVVTQFNYDAKHLEDEEFGVKGELQGNFKIFLTSQPKAPVKIVLKGEDLPDKAISPQTVTFTPENWDQPQTVTVDEKGVDFNGKDKTKIITQPAKSADPLYDGYKPTDVEISVPVKIKAKAN